MHLKSELTAGILYEYRQKVIENLIYKVDSDVHADTYTVRDNYDMYAEPEFTGKYLDLCMKIYRTYKTETALANAKKVVDSIVRNQREDGFLGCLPKGKETLNFGVWNQAFTVLGLLSYYNGTCDERALDAACKCVTYVMNYFIGGNVDILDSLNYGTQHISILYPLCKLYRITNKEQFKDYIQYIIEKIRNSDLNFLDFEDVLEIRSKKGIENFVVLLGILEYADIFGDKRAVNSVEKYWQQIADTQIRNTGNGTINELWTEGGNACMLLGEDIKANETCVAVGWIELSLALFHLKQDAKYLNAIDKTLYNHILASIAEDGSDFAYYQPNYGKKLKNTEVGMYKCCRYRGFTLFSYMDEMLYYEDDNAIIPMIYTSSDYQSEDVKVSMETNYPFDNVVMVSVVPRKEKQLKLRIPKNNKVVSVAINKCQVDYKVLETYICIDLQKNVTLEIEVEFAFELVPEYGQIEGTSYVSYSYGCVLLANAILKGHERMAYEIDGKSYCDYASADEYHVWVPLKSGKVG